jgi:hypothetical protein
MATTKKAKPKKKARARGIARTHKFAPFEYLVDVIGGRVVIKGANDGSIYGKAGQLVSFSCAPRIQGFTFEAWGLQRNDSKRQPVPKWPFTGPQPNWPQFAFSGRLRSPGLFKKSYYKYSIAVTGAISADPIIIIERRSQQVNGFELTAMDAECVTAFLQLASGELTEEQLAEWIAVNSSARR